MSYQYANIRGNDVAKSRVGHITKGYALGGAVQSVESPVDRKSGGRTGKSLMLKMEGGVAKARADRPGRAHGGRAPKAKGNNVNVIIAPQGGAPNSPAAPGVGGPIPGGLPAMAKPPMPPPLAGPPGMGGGMAPPGMPHANGGRAYAKGGAVKTGPAFAEGKKEGTKVQPLPEKNDIKDIGRKKPITFKTGGPVFAQSTGQHGPKFDGGGGGGTARLEKEARAARNYKKV